MLYKKKILSYFKKIPIIFVIGCMLILYFQYEAWKFKVRYVPPSDYAENAVDLKVTKDMRYGFVWSYHGSFLVKTGNTIGLHAADQKDRKTPPMPQGEDDEATDHESGVLNPNAGTQHLDDDQMFKVPTQMREELELVPVKTALETVLVFDGILLDLPGAILAGQSTPVLSHVQRTSWRNFWAATASGTVCFWIMSLPFIIFNYGHPLFSTWIGPGAMSYSVGSVPSSYGPGMTISYRVVYEMLTFFPKIIFLSFAEPLPEWSQTIIFFGLFVPAFFGAYVTATCRLIWVDIKKRFQRE